MNIQNFKKIEIIAFISNFLSAIAIIIVTIEWGMVLYLIYTLLSLL